MQRICIVCNTFFQLIMAMQLKKTVFSLSNVSVVITDQSPANETMIEKLIKLGCFNNVYFIKSLAYCKVKKTLRGKASDVLTILNGKKVSDIPGAKYDLLLYYNMDMTVLGLFANLYAINKDIYCARFEEGILSYNNAVFDCLKYKLGNFLRKLFRKKSILDRTLEFYCCNPPLYSGNLKVVEIPKIIELGSIGRELRIIFDLKDTDLIYKEKYIYFTSVYDFEGGSPIGEIDFVKALRNRVGNDNLLVKVHPRDSRTIYEDEKFNVDRNSKIPWEAIQLNIDCTDKVFVTVNSGSVLSINMLVEPMPKTVFGYKCCNYSDNVCAQNTISNLEVLLHSDNYKAQLENVQIINSVDEL